MEGRDVCTIHTIDCLGRREGDAGEGGGGEGCIDSGLTACLTAQFSHPTPGSAGLSWLLS